MIIDRLGLRIHVAVSVVYCRDGSVDFVVTKNLPPHLSAVRTTYSDAVRIERFLMTCPYLTTEIVLLIPSTLIGGWSIRSSFSPPTINVNDIIAFEQGMSIPRIKLLMEWVGERDPEEGRVEIGIQGGNMGSFILTCTPPVSVEDTWVRKRAQEATGEMESGSQKLQQLFHTAKKPRIDHKDLQKSKGI